MVRPFGVCRPSARVPRTVCRTPSQARSSHIVLEGEHSKDDLSQVSKQYGVRRSTA